MKDKLQELINWIEARRNEANEKSYSSFYDGKYYAFDEAIKKAEQLLSSEPAITDDKQDAKGSCPCLYLDEPCDSHCTCRNGLYSHGCQFCCSYGSIAQRKARAKIIADKLRDGKQDGKADQKKKIIEIMHDDERLGLYESKQDVSGSLAIIEQLQLRVSHCESEPNDMSWGMQEGVLLTKREAEKIIQLLTNKASETVSGNQQDVLICNNCKRFWIAPKDKCDCGCQTLSVTHSSNAVLAKNYSVSGKDGLGSQQQISQEEIEKLEQNIALHMRPYNLGDMGETETLIRKLITAYKSAFGSQQQPDFRYVKTLIPAAKRELDEVYKAVGHMPPVLRRLVEKLENIISGSQQHSPDEEVYVLVRKEDFDKSQYNTAVDNVPMISKFDKVYQVFVSNVDGYFKEGWKVLKKVKLSSLLNSELTSTSGNSIEQKPVSNLDQSFGELVFNSMGNWDKLKEDVSTKTDLPINVIDAILSDTIYPNCVPIRLMARLIKFLCIEVDALIPAFKNTYNLLKQKESPNRWKEVPYASLWENAEALDKYVKRLTELLNSEQSPERSVATKSDSTTEAGNKNNLNQ